MMVRFLVLLVALSVTLPNMAAAYIGPGAGLSAIGTAVAVVGAFFLLILGFIWYPVKRLLRRKQSTDPATSGGQSGDSPR